MKKLNLDFFKIVILVLLLWVAYSLHNFSVIGRYQLGDNEGRIKVIDTKSGRTFRLKATKQTIKPLNPLDYEERNKNIYELIEHTKPIDEY